MRILHVTPTYVPAWRYGGPIRSVHGLCRGLAGRGHEVHVFTTNVDGAGVAAVPLEVPVDVDGVKVRYFPSKSPRRLYRSPRMADFLNREAGGFDLVHLHSLYLWPTWAAARAARASGIPYLVSPRGMLVKDLVRRKSRWIKTAWLRLIERRNLEDASAVHFTSPLEAREADRFGFRLPPAVVIPNGVDMEGKDAPAVLSELVAEAIRQRPFLLFLGRINWKKGLDRLIAALAHVPDVRLVIAGNDEEDYRSQLERLIAEKGVGERICFSGHVRGADKAALFKNAALFVLPSYSENFGIAVLEAMAAGCPVIITPEVGAADIVREHRAGLVIDGDPRVLGKGLHTMLMNPEELVQMGRRGRKAVEGNFTWDAVALKMEAAYTQILCGDDINKATGTSAHA